MPAIIVNQLPKKFLTLALKKVFGVKKSQIQQRIPMVWKMSIDISETFDEVIEQGDHLIPKLCLEISQKLEALPKLYDPVLEDMRQTLVGDFKGLHAIGCEDPDQFDEFMELLYDWGDTIVGPSWNHKLCWINTILTR